MKDLGNEYGNHIIDFDELGFRDVSQSFLKVIYQMFIDETASQLELLEQAIVDSNVSMAEMCGHTIKGTASNIGATNLGVIAFRVEQAAIDNNIGFVTRHIPELKHEFARVHVLLEQIFPSSNISRK